MVKKSKTPKRDNNKLKHKQRERWAYIVLLAAIVVYGFFDSEAAVRLVEAIHKAFSLLIN